MKEILNVYIPFLAYNQPFVTLKKKILDSNIPILKDERELILK